MASSTSTYTILTSAKGVEGSIKYWANHDLIPAAQCLEEAQAWVYQRLRVREMIVRTPLALSASDETIDLDATAPGFQQPIRLKLDGYGKLEYKCEENFPDDRDSDGELPSGPPSCWTVIGTLIHLDTKLSAAMNGDIWYYGTPDALAAGNQTNFLTDKYPTLLRHACLARAYASRNRADMVTIEETLAMAEINKANATNDDHRFGQGI
ncbi:hypothetical protein [Bauldia litoralis]|uniref:phage adaptor protein n=1 Tax=Bauldia litoralis TaxID=665467 RepID=UPI003265F89E